MRLSIAIYSCAVKNSLKRLLLCAAELLEHADLNISANLLATTVGSLAPSTVPETVSWVVKCKLSLPCLPE